VLLKVGIVMMGLSVALAVGTAAVMVLARDDPAQGETFSVEPVAAQTPAAPPPPPEETVEEPAPRPAPRPEEPARQTAPPPSDPPPERPAPEPPPPPQPPPPPPPVVQQEWPLPGEGEAEAAEEPRSYAPAPSAAMTLTVPALGVYDAPVFDSDAPQALDQGVAHVPETSMPWDAGAQRNVYLAAHRLGYEGTGSRLLFYRLDQLGRGDEVVLEGGGRTYRYRVTEELVVDPWDSWVMGQVRGRDMVSLQTCTPIPTFEKRLVVRADRV
jgi:sortase A